MITKEAGTKGIPTSIPALKNTLPFRLGTTSYILPDDLLPNVEFLAPLVDDVELLLFESDAMSNLPDARVIQGLAALQRVHGISYTVHLPLDIHLGSRDEIVRKQSVEKCLSIIELCDALVPFAYIVHWYGDRRGPNPVLDYDDWIHALDRSTTEMLSAGVPPEILCIETLEYPFELVAGTVVRHGLSICLDAGHLAFYGYPVQEYLDHYLDRSRVIHLHGNAGGIDHKDLGALPPQILDMLLRRLLPGNGMERVVTMEVFGLPEFDKSMSVLKEAAG